jgi:hypothetical protein
VTSTQSERTKRGETKRWEAGPRRRTPKAKHLRGVPASRRACHNSAPRRRGPSRGHDDVGRKDRGPALGLAPLYVDDPPCCRHNAPLSIAAAVGEGVLHLFGVSKYSGSLRIAARRLTRRYEADTYVCVRQALTKPKLRSRTTEHSLPVLIFDELEYEPLLRKTPVAQRQFQNSTTKSPRNGLVIQTIARLRTAGASSRFRTAANVCHNILI